MNGCINERKYIHSICRKPWQAIDLVEFDQIEPDLNVQILKNISIILPQKAI